MSKQSPLLRACPRCHAVTGAYCIGPKGRQRKAFHRERGRGKGPVVAKFAEHGLETESPIEHTLVGAIKAWADHFNVTDLRIATQVDVGPYRADIMLTRGKAKLAVECDGAAYHNSKDAVLKDKRRDRYFVANGISVMRFTGSEIHRSVRNCATEIGLWVGLQT